ncbi:myo-inosose-2 dehydratase [Flavobacteriaceae bacterium]|jgi:inosose dehydratase|nr:myo-inosose-2 dehydratase [Flavobacteriaceae bacterium]|tara:strand:+ start:200 stop:1084 length:885 start_codon:yes stop_codon:yes gene_type:complete
MIKLGIAPIGWTNDDMPELGSDITFEQCVSEMALAGYEGCEVGNKYPTHDRVLLKEYLDVRGLTICNQWFSYEFTAKPFEEVKNNFIKQVDFLSFMGANVIGGAECGNTIHGDYYMPLTNRKVATKKEWFALTKGLNELGKIANDNFGMKLSYHHHMGTMVESMDEVDRLLNETDERYVSLNYDCGHFYFANEDPHTALKKYMSRTTHIHLKDVRDSVKERAYIDDLSFLKAVKLGVYTVPGDGDLDLKPIADNIHKSDYKGWVVVEAEQDPSIANPFEYAKKGYDFLTQELKF